MALGDTFYKNLAALIENLNSDSSASETAIFNYSSICVLRLITVSIKPPEKSLQKNLVYTAEPSDHVFIVCSQKTFNTFTQTALSLTLSSLFEWHSFVNIPNRDRMDSWIIVAKAGDWTTAVIENFQKYFWVCGIPTADVITVSSFS